ncbi:MAG: hypothetical protein RJA61_592 [Candidatus Parcubacteria bacterium]|jgi:large subunit ribosomal protein L25
MITLEFQKRDVKKDLETLRKEGIMPAVFYGKKQASTPIAVPLKIFLKVLKEAGESTVVTLKEGNNEYDALIHEVDINPVTDVPRHADFYVFEKGQKIEIDVPLEFIGVSPAVKELSGVLVKVLYELKIEAEPKNLPHEINVDISSLVNFESRILAKDIVLPEGVTLLEKADEVVALVSEAKEEKEEEAAPVDLSAIEVEKKGKEKDGAAPAEGEGEAEKK